MRHWICWVLCATIVLGITPGIARGAISDAQYSANFVAYWAGQGQIPATVPTLENYATQTSYDQLYLGGLNYYISTINSQQNDGAFMGWGSSYFSHSLNDMYVATGNVKYLDAGLRLARASLANTDRAKGYLTFFGEAAPAWGTDNYAARWVVHPVHTGMIGFGIAEFLYLTKGRTDIVSQVEWDTMLTSLTLAVDWHNRAWIDGPAADEGYYIYKDVEPGLDGQPEAGNRQSAMGRTIWYLWKAGGQTRHRDQALKLGRYMKRRIGLYVPERQGGAYFWRYDLAINPINNPRPWAERLTLGGGEDFSHAALTMAFMADLGLDGQIFTADDMECLGRTVTNGFARLNNGIIFGNVVGTTALGPDQVVIQGYWLRLTPFYPEVYDRIAELQLRYQKTPRNVDLSQMIRFMPRKTQAGGFVNYE